MCDALAFAHEKGLVDIIIICHGSSSFVCIFKSLLISALHFVCYTEISVAHHDVKGGNILIDASAGGKLLLADFGTALKPGEETVGFTKSYASPELLASYELEDFADLRPGRFGVCCLPLFLPLFALR